MGISTVLGVVATAFLILSFRMLQSGFSEPQVAPVLYYALIGYILAMASPRFPSILGKAPDGKFPLWSRLVFSPFFVWVKLYVLFKSVMTFWMEPAFSEIAEGLYVGGWPTTQEHLPPGKPAVIDCTCELHRFDVVSDVDAYLCIPTWDTRSPQQAQIEDAVRWACKFRTQGRPVLVYCSFGHGRSGCVMCAVLVALGVAEDWKHAERLVREKRPSIRLNADQRKNLEEWSKYQHLSPRGSEDRLQ